MADEDFVDFDQEWFFDELKGEQTEGTTLDPPLPASPLPAASSSNNDHASTSQSSHQQMQQQIQQQQQTIHQSNHYQEQQIVQRDGMMPSTSSYGMQQQQHHQQQSVLQEQQVPISQHQQHQMQQVQHPQQHQQPQQQQYESLQPLQTYNPNQQQNQNIQYQQNSMIYETEFMLNEASTSSAMPPECRISQEYNQPHQYQQMQQQQQQQGDNQWMQVDHSSQMNQQHMNSVVYSSTSQQMPRIPDPGGPHITNQPQIINNYPQQNQQIIHTGINGETILTNMQPVQQIQRIIPQQLQQQQQQQLFDLNSNSYAQPQVAYIDPTGSHQFISSQGESGNISFQQPVMQVIPQIISMQSVPPPETSTPAPAPPKPKATKNTPRPNGRKKNQPPPPPQPQAPPEGDSILSKIGAFGSVAVNFNPEKAQKMAELMGMISSLQPNDTQGRIDLERQLEELLTGANIIPQPTKPAPPPPKPTANYQPIAPNSNIPTTSASSTPQPKPVKKPRTKAEQKQNIKQKMAANAATMNMPPQQQIIPQQQQQPQPPPNESGYRILSQDANYLIVESNGKLMKAVNVRTENGTATYQILGPVDDNTLNQMTQPPPQQPPPPPPPQPVQQQKRVQPIQPSVFKPSESEETAPAAVLDVVNSLSSSNKSKPQKKTPARSRNKKASEPPPPVVATEQKPVIPEPEVVKPEPTVICVPSASKEPPKPKIVFPAIAVSARRVKDKTESRKKRISEWIKKLKEAISTTDINSPFIDKEDVFNRLMPYGFHYEPEISKKTMEKLDHELVRHQTHLFDRYKNIEAKMQQIFIRDTTRQNFDLEKNMLLALDAEYEKQQLEKDKALFHQDPYQFIRESDVLKTPTVNDEYITETRKLLNQNKPKNHKPTKGFHFEPSHFDEQAFIKRKQKLIEEDEEKERKEKLAAFRKAHPPPPVRKAHPPDPVHKPSPKAVPFQTPKLPPKPSIEPVKINIKLQEAIVPINKEVPQKTTTKKPVVFTSSSESSSSDEDYVKAKITKSSKKSKSFRSPSPQKERKSKSPQKSKTAGITVSKEKLFKSSSNLSNDKHGAKDQPPIKTTIRKPMPPEFALYPSMNLSDYKIPKIGEEPSSTPKPLPVKPEMLQKEKPKFIEPKIKAFVKPFDPPKIKENIFSLKIKENVVETLKIKKSSLSNAMDSSSLKEKKEDKHRHHHHHHHHHHQSSKNGERSNSVISNHSNPESSKKAERSESLNRETSKVPSLVIKPPLQFKQPNEIKKEEKRSKEKEKSSKEKHLKDTVKAEEKPLKTKIEIPKPENLEPATQQPLKLKINFGFKKPIDPPLSTSVSTKEPSSNTLPAPVEEKKRDKKEKHSKESRKEKKTVDEAPPKLEIVEEKQNHIGEKEEDKAEKEAKRKRKEEKKRQKAEKKQRKLEKKQRKEEGHHQKEEEATKATPQTNSPGGEQLKLKLSFKKPMNPVEAAPSQPSPLPPPPPLLPQQPEPMETTPKLKFTFSRNILPESSKKSKKEKDRNLKRESPKIESEPNLEAPPPKIPRVKIKIGAPKNLAAAAGSSSSSSFPAALTPIPPSPTTTAAATTSAPMIPAVEKKKSIITVEKQMENSEYTASAPLQIIQPQAERPSMVGQPPTTTLDNVTGSSPKIKRMKKSRHGGSGFSDCSDVEETQFDLRSMTDRILSRCRD